MTGDPMLPAVWYIGILAICALVYLVTKNMLTKSRLLRFFGVLIIGTVSSMFPWGPMGLFLGFPSAFLAAILVTAFIDKGE